MTLDINVNVFDSDREKSLPLLQTGLSTSNGSPAYQCRGDSSPQRYVANGELCIVPHDYCPVCWGRWDAKRQNPTCPNCNVSMGTQVKLLLDSDVCPNCENGSVTASDPSCSQCGYCVNPNYVVWGVIIIMPDSFNVCLDESSPEARASGNADNQFLMIGSLWLPREKRTQFKDTIHKLRDKHKVGGEFKWNRVSPSRVDFYCELIELFFAEKDDLRFRCIAVDCDNVDLKEWIGSNLR